MSICTLYPGRFICENLDCPTKNLIKKIHVWTDRKEEPKCDNCGQTLREVFEEINSTPFHIGKFNTLSDAEKRKVLKKRSHDHFEKHIKERKDYMDKNFTGTEKI